MVGLSPAEYSYLRTSLESVPSIRPDARLDSQYRPLQAATNFMPTCYGSARIRTSDGGECIVGIKAKVTRTSSPSSSIISPDGQDYNQEESTSQQPNHAPKPVPLPQLIKVNVDMAGVRDDDPALTSISSTIQRLLQESPVLTAEKLRLTSRFSFTLFVDALVLSHQGSNPLTLVSLAVYLALLTTKLPRLLSSVDDSAAEEIPVFDDDWDNAIPLTGNVSSIGTTLDANDKMDLDESFSSNKKQSKINNALAPKQNTQPKSLDEENKKYSLYYKTTPWKPPFVFVFAVIGENILVDPSLEEESVADGILTIGWQQGHVIAPLRYVETFRSSAAAAATANLTTDENPNPITTPRSKASGVTPSILKKAYALALDAGNDVSEALDLVAKLDLQDEAISGPATMF